MAQPSIVCVAGPTASGKTQLAVALAKKLHGEVVSCDSMQVYRHMNIGTAKPTREEMDGIPHHMLDVAEPEEAFSAGRYVEQADPIVQDILARGKTCILCGGTGLYMDSLMAGRTFAPIPQTGRREALEQLAAAEGIEAVLQRLRQVDPESADRLHPSDQRRIIRALEVYEETGTTITAHNEETKKQPPRYQGLWLGLDFEDRAELYARIDLRVEKMMAEGLPGEIEMLLRRGVPQGATSLQAIGYKEPLAAFRGEMTMEQAVEKIKQESRRYAKRQLTWFRRNEKIHWLYRRGDTPPEDLLAQAVDLWTNFDGIL